MATVQEILDYQIPAPTFSLRPTEASPIVSELTLNRGSAGWVLDKNRDVLKYASGDPRIYGTDQNLVLEPQRTQLVDAPGDFGGWLTTRSSVTEDVGKAKGKDYDQIVDNTNNAAHYIRNSFSGAAIDGKATTAAFIVRPQPIQYVWVQMTLDDGSGTKDFSKHVFNIANHTVVSTDTPNYGTVLETNVFDVGGGFSLVVYSILPDAGFQADQVLIGPAESGNIQYAGSGSAVLDILYGGAEHGTYATTPILSGQATRNQDAAVLDGSILNDEEATILGRFKVRGEAIGSGDGSKFPKILWANDSNDRLEITFKTDPPSLSFFDNSTTNNAEVQVVKPYEYVDFALSIKEDRVIIAGNGQSSTLTGYDKSDFLSQGSFDLTKNRMPFHLDSLSVLPEGVSQGAAEALTA